MTLEIQVGEGCNSFEDKDLGRDEHPAVVVQDMADRRRPNTHLIVFANEKGGVGKSTLAFHCALVLAHMGHRVLTLDCDRRQQTLNRLLQARDGTVRTLKADLPSPRHAVIEKPSGAMLLQEIERLGKGCDIVIVDLPGHDSPLARRAIAIADTVVTPINSSPADMDALGWINPVSRRLRQPGPFANVVIGLKEERIARGMKPFDWVVARNRVRNCERRLIASADRDLMTMARHLEFRLIDGLTERLAYRELLTFGLSHLDLKLIPSLGRPRTGHARELRRLVECLQLPAVQPAANFAACSSLHRAPVSARTADSYREALYAAATAGAPVC